MFDCFAYIDPGTGSYIFQVIVAAIVAIPFLFKSGLKKLFKKSK